MKRREFFHSSALLGAAGLSVSFGAESARGDETRRESFYGGQQGKPLPEWGDEPVEHLTSYHPDFADKNLWIRKDNEVVTVYRTGPNQKYPYLYPLIGPRSFVSVTAESAQPWPHHRSVFLGADRVNGGNYWQCNSTDGQILSQGVELLAAEKSRVEWADRCLWKKPDTEPVIEDTRRYVLDWRSDDYYVLDAFFTFKMLCDVEIQKTNHGFFGVRVEQDLCPYGGGHLVSSEGAQGEEATFGKPARWMAFWGARRFNPAITEGVAVFCPPKPFEQCPWFTRDYGNCSPMPFNFVAEGFRWPKGESFDAVYRTVVFAGSPKDVDLDGLWNEIYG